MQFIEHYPDGEDRTTEIEGRTFHLPCLVEDDYGIRLLLTYCDDQGKVQIPVRTWSTAHAGGAAAIVDTGLYRSMLAETFMDGRTEHHASASYVAPSDWNPLGSDPITYMDIARREPVESSTPTSRLVHIHAHSEYSPLDGLSHVGEMVEQVMLDGQTALALTDHGMCAGHPALQKAADKAGIKPIFGIEANFTNDRKLRGDPEIKEGPGSSRYVLGDYTHLVLWAMDDAGLLNLWAMSTESNATGFYGRPRMDWETLETYAEGVMAGTGCLRGPLADALLAGEDTEARSILARLMDIFPDRLYVEIHTNHLPEVIRLNHLLIALAKEYDLPIVASVDSHYPCKADAETHSVWIAMQIKKSLTDDADLFAGVQQYHLMTEAEARKALDYLDPADVDDAIENTGLLAERCTARVHGKAATPIYSKAGEHGEADDASRIRRDVARLVDMCLVNWDRKVVGKPDPEADYEARFEREMRLLIDKDFCGYFLMVADYCSASKDGRVSRFDPARVGETESSIIVGPGRGSGGGSLVGYLCGITEIDAVEHDLLFERFLTDGREGLPDFDVDFPESKRAALMGYLAHRYGDDHILRVGTQIRLKNKGVVRSLGSTLRGTVDIDYADLDAVSKIIDAAEADKAGLGISWEDLWAQHADELDPHRAKYPDLFRYADRMVGRLNSYGKHPAGVIIATDEPLTGRLPMRRAGDDKTGYEMVAEFDLDSLEDLGYVKFDLLTLRTLDSIQETVDMVLKERGQVIDVYAWREEYNDPQVWDEISEGHTLGIFQIETRPGTQLTKRFRPRNLDELADVITLVRPGPVRSGLTETYFNRKAGLEPVTFPDPRLEAVLGKTYGAMLYQEDIMAATMLLAGYDSNEADAVRKILGKKQIEKVAEAGFRFVKAAVENGMERDDAEHLWEQMAEFALYSFNRAHAYGYAVLGFWTAWLKFHYPAQYLNSLMTTVDKGRVPEFVNEARRMGFKVLPPDINISGVGFTSHEIEIRYGLDKVKGIGQAAVKAITQGQPYTSFDDFMDRKGSNANIGVVKVLAAVGAFDSIEPNRKALEARLTIDTKDAKQCAFRDDSAMGPGGLPCVFDWANEVDPPMVAKGRGKDKTFSPKPPPKRCTIACRNFTPPVISVESLAPYTDAEIRDKEMALLGIHLSSTPFDRIPPDVLADECFTAEDVEGGPDGEYVVAATISQVKKHITKAGKDMGFLSVFAQTADLDVTVFSDQWERFRDVLKVGALCFLYVRKNDRGANLIDIQTLD